MEPREPPPPLPPSATTSPPQQPTEEDGNMSANSAMAKQAALFFQSRRYQECIDVLTQISQKKEDDPKVVHNITIAECYRDGCSDPKILLDVLNNVKRRSEDLARVSGEQAEAATSSAGNASSGSKGSSNILLPQLSGTSSDPFAYADEFDTSVVTLNIATVFYHLREYGRALTILEPLYQNIEPIEEGTALRVCLLMLDIALASEDASKAADIIDYLERTFGFRYLVNQGENGSAFSSQQASQTLKLQPVSTNLASIDALNLDSSFGNASEATLTSSLSDEAEDYETLFSTLNISDQSLARPAAALVSNDAPLGSSNQSPAVIDLKLKLQLYKVRLLLLTRNLKATKREVKSVMNIARGRDSSTALLLKSQLEYARGNHRKAVKLLMTSSSRTDQASSSVFFNNLGCIYHQLRKHTVATFFFSKALDSSLSLRKEKPMKLVTYSQDKSLFIAYNCGLQYLISGKPITAAHCFQKASAALNSQPILWLRLAECALLALEKGLLGVNGVIANCEEVQVHVVGSGRWRQLIVDDASAKVRHLDSLKEVDLLSGDGPCKLSLPFARQCLVNSLYLLDKYDIHPKKAVPDVAALLDEEAKEGTTVVSKSTNQKTSSMGDSKTSNAASANGDLKESKGGSCSNATIQSSVSAYEELHQKENLMIKQAVLAGLAFVELSLENPLKALLAARALLQLPDCLRIYIFLGNIYAAESLCYLNRPKEAADHLSVYVSEGMDVDLPFTVEDTRTWRNQKDTDSEEPNNVQASKTTVGGTNSDDLQNIVFMSGEEACGSLFVNFAAMSAMQGDLEQAHKFALQAVATIPSNPLATLSLVYVDLLLGRMQDAILRLKQCRHLRFLPTDITLSSS